MFKLKHLFLAIISILIFWPHNGQAALVENYAFASIPYISPPIRFTFYKTFNNSLQFNISEYDQTLDTEIEAINLEVKSATQGDVFYSAQTPERQGQFMLNFADGLLSESRQYDVDATIHYQLKSDPRQKMSKTYRLAQLTNGDYIAKFTDNVYFNPSPSTPNGTFTFRRNTNNHLSIMVGEQTKISDTEIGAMVLSVKDKNNLTVYSDATGDRFHQFELDFSNGFLSTDERYTVDITINYNLKSDNRQMLTKTYPTTILVNGDYIAPTPQPTPTPTPTPSPTGHSFSQTVQPAWYCGSKKISETNELCTGSLVYVNNQVTELRSGIDPIVMIVSQGTNTPTINRITYLANNQIIKTCAKQSCSLTYILPNAEQTLLQAKVDFADGVSTTQNIGYYLLQNVTGGNSPSKMMGSLYTFIKGSGPQVYLKTLDGGRYYVNDWAILKSWYTPETFTSGYIQTVSDSTLALFPLKGNIIYRPGSLVKISTDPKCYTVDKDGKLRWVKNETIARTLYGSTWNKNIYIIPDALFMNYGFGTEIDNANNYSLPTLNEVINMYNN